MYYVLFCGMEDSMRRDHLFLQFRITPAERARLERVASADFLSVPMWAKQQVLRAIETAEVRVGPPGIPFDGVEAGR
jgi:hypothetical protein